MARTISPKLFWKVWFRHDETEVFVSVCVLATGRIQARNKGVEFVKRYKPTPIFWSVEPAGIVPVSWRHGEEPDANARLSEVDELADQIHTTD